MAMKELMDRNILKFIISQNIDGLHLRSGVRSNQIAELHGNVYLEFCTSCGREYLRDFHVRGPKGSKHMTGHSCESYNCQGLLKDTVINFGENLSSENLDKSARVSALADLHVCLGSSMRVSPANIYPEMTKNAGGKVVIINLQKTPVDEICDLVIHERIDVVMKLLMSKL